MRVNEIIKYQVSEVFDSVSGEAPTSGQKATFVRLSGCPIRCKFCDTSYAIFNDTEQYKLGYLQGVRWGDGYLGEHGFSLGAKDCDFVECVRDFAESVFGTNCNVREKVRGLEAKKPGAIYYRLDFSKLVALEKIDDLPRTVEGRRGFVAGFFDSEGSHSVSGYNSGENIEFSNSKRVLLDYTARCLEEFGFLSRVNVAYNQTMNGNLFKLSLVAYHRENSSGMSVTERRQLKNFTFQRFFDVFQPRIMRKYGTRNGVTRLARGCFTHSLMSVDEIVSLCNETLVIITGAEPLITNLDLLLARLHFQSHVTQIETSGFCDFKGVERPRILVCSPKAAVSYKVTESVLSMKPFLKFVYGPEHSGFDWNIDIVRELSKCGSKTFIMPFGCPPTPEVIVEVQNVCKQNSWEFSPRLQYTLGVR